MRETEELQFNRKHRPTSLSEYNANKRSVQTIMSVMNTKRPQSMFFTGDAGCGKTSLARLIAKEYSCTNRDPDKGACGVCPMCQIIQDYITDGSTDELVNIRELNCVKQNKKRDMENIMEEMQLQTLDDYWRIYIFDECHEATSEAQNSLLKLVEEPPKNILMIFCTTEPDKLLPTLRSRLHLKLPITKPTGEELTDLLTNIATKEGILTERKALNLIAGRVNFTPRDAILLFERIFLEKGNVTYVSALDVMQSVAEALLFEFYENLINKDVYAYIRFLHNIQKKIDLKQFMDNLTNFTTRGIYVINGIDVDGLSDKEIGQYRRLFSSFSIEQISNLLRILVELKKSKNLETELLVLGYSGIEDSTGVKKDKSTKGMQIAEILEENKVEGASSAVARRDKFKIDETESEKYIKEMTSATTAEDILGMFDGIEAEDL